MTWVTHPLTLKQFATRFADFVWTRSITAVDLHHTFVPNHDTWRGEATVRAMRDFHINKNGWSDIAQHVTIAPDGIIWTGRDWNRPPASSHGYNGTARAGPFMLEVVGNFDRGRDVFGGMQRRSALGVVAVIQNLMKLPHTTLRFHRQLGSTKTCPGTTVDYDATLDALLLIRTGLTLEVK